MVEFNDIRAKLYEEALTEYPEARNQDITEMYKYLDPRCGEKILGFGEGNGFFVPHILGKIGTEGKYLVIDPSSNQLANLVRKYTHPALETRIAGVEELNIFQEYDKVWSFGAFHHCKAQNIAMTNVHNSLRVGGLAVICDVWRGSALAEHFDGPVSKYCCTGHDAQFLGDTYARTISENAGFRKVKIESLPIKWRFDSEYDIGRFIYKLHAMTLIKGVEDEEIAKVLEGCKSCLGVEKTGDTYELNWPMKVLVAKK